MTNDSSKSDAIHSETIEEFANYRCVCGELVSVQSSQLACPKCGRQYDSDVLRSATAETAEFDPNQSVRISGQTRETELLDDEFIDQQLGHFRILEPIGRGGMGAVYRALDESLERYVAIKVLRQAKVSANDTNLERLFHEARAQARVNHPNVAHIYYVGREGDTPYLAMELVGNKTLADRLLEGSIPFDLIAHYGFQVAAALDAASKFDIVHGDVKPANVLMVDDRTVKLSDFGLSSRLSQEASGAGKTAGTPNYMPPEALSGSIDHRGDMYSLGVALFEMTFGKLPYASSSKSNDVTHVMSLHRDAMVEFPEPWPDGLPEQWRDILSKLLAKDPNDRYASFHELGIALKAVQPTVLPGASPLLRALAWAADTFVVAMPLFLIAAVAAVFGILQSFPILPMIASGGWVFAFGALQVAWGTTPGKRLFQIRIVDQHGLKPPRHVLGGRSAFQFSFAWAWIADNLLQQLRLDFLPGMFLLLATLFTVIEFGMIIFRSGRSIHDAIFKTYVVLDA